jgi:hypothetical protein
MLDDADSYQGGGEVKDAKALFSKLKRSFKAAGSIFGGARSRDCAGLA